MCKPNAAKKNRGDQFLFINNRFFKNAYLHFTIQKTFEHLISSEYYVGYVVFITMNPKHFDVNIHPTKHEVKFDDDKLVNSFLHSALKHALAKYAITPSIDFSLTPEIQHNEAIKISHNKEHINNAVYNKPIAHTFNQPHQAHFIEKSPQQNWQSFFEPLHHNNPVNTKTPLSQNLTIEELKNIHWHQQNVFQFANEYIITPLKNVLLIVHQQNAHQSILYQQLLQKDDKQMPVLSEQLLFPITFELAPAEAALLHTLMPQFCN